MWGILRMRERTVRLTSVLSGISSRLVARLTRHRVDVPDAIAGRVRFEQLVSIQRLTPVMMVANIVNAQLVCLAGLRGPHRMTLALWAGVVTCYALLGLRGWVSAQRRKGGKTTVSARGVRRIVLQAGVLGGLWAILPLMAMSPEQGFAGAMPMLVASVLAGMIGCGGFAMLTLPAAAIAYSTPMVIGALWALATSHDPILYALGGLLIFCHLVVSVSCLSHAKIFVERLVAADELEQQRQVVSLLLSDFEEGASDWLWEVDASGRLTYVSDRMAAAAGMPKEALLGQPMSDLCGAAEGPGGAFAALSALFAEQKTFRDVVVSIGVGEETHWWSLSAKPVLDMDGAFIGFRGVGADITQAREPEAAPVPYSQILRMRGTWAFALAFAITAPVFWFYLYWLPPFLNKELHLGISVAKMGIPLVVIYLTADIGSIGGGALSSWMIKRGMQPVNARLLSMLICAICILSVILAAEAHQLWMAVGAIAIALGTHQAWTANIWSMVMDYTPRHVVSSVFGFGGMIGAIGGMFMTQIVGYVLTATNDNYAVLFTLIPCMYFIALTWLYFMAPRKVEGT